MVPLSLISRALIIATPGGHSRLNSGSTVVLACGVSIPTRPRGAYSSDMSEFSARYCGACAPDSLTTLPSRDDIAGHDGGEVLRRAGNERTAPAAAVWSSNIVALQRLDEFVVELADDGGRRAGRREQPEPLLHLRPREIRPRAWSERPGCADGAASPAIASMRSLPPSMWPPRRDVGREQHVHPARDRVGDGGRDPAIGHVHQLDTGLLGEQFAEQVSAGSDPLRAVAQTLRLRLGERDQLGGRLRRARLGTTRMLLNEISAVMGWKSFTGSNFRSA